MKRNVQAEPSEPIGIVGTGPVACGLGRLLLEAGEPVVAVASRHAPRASAAAAFIGGSVRPSTIADLPQHATRILVATSDDVITQTAGVLAAAGLDRGVALHTCGAVGAEALGPLRQRGVACGVFHPIQSLVAAEQALESLKHITFGVSGDTSACRWAERIAVAIESRVVFVDPNQMPAYHAAAVLASNALVGLLDAAVVLMGQAGVGAEQALDALGPLSRTTLENVLRLGPVKALTGPIVRGNVGTVSLHTAALERAPSDVTDLYRAASRRLLDLARRRGLPEDRIRALAEALDPSHAGETDGYQARPNA